jgi:hypothetical protein
MDFLLLVLCKPVVPCNLGLCDPLRCEVRVEPGVRAVAAEKGPVALYTHTLHISFSSSAGGAGFVDKEWEREKGMRIRFVRTFQAGVP